MRVQTPRIQRKDAAGRPFLTLWNTGCGRLFPNRRKEKSEEQEQKTRETYSYLRKKVENFYRRGYNEKRRRRWGNYV